MRRSGRRCAPPCGNDIRTRCRSCWRCRSSGGWSATSPGSRARWSGDPQARAAVAVGGRAGSGRGRADRGSGIAHRDQHHRLSGGRGSRRSPAPGHGPAPGARATPGAGRAHRLRRDGGRADAGRRPRGGPGQRPAVGRAGRPARGRGALPRGAAGLRAGAAREPDSRRGAHRPRRAAVTPRVVERRRDPPPARVGGRPRPGGRLVLSRGSAQSRGPARRRADRLRARRRARAPQHAGALPPGDCARPAQSPGRSHADVSPLAGGYRQVIRVVVDDLAFLAATAVVRPATTRLDPTTPAVRRLETVGGTAFTRGLQVQKELAVGAAVVTAGGGDLPADFVIHAVIQSDTEPVTRDGVARAWRATLHQAQEWEFTSLTVPPIGTGAGNLSIEDAADIMVPILKTHLGTAAFPASVSIVVETPEERDAFEAALRRSGAAES